MMNYRRIGCLHIQSFAVGWLNKVANLKLMKVEAGILLSYLAIRKLSCLHMAKAGI